MIYLFEIILDYLYIGCYYYLYKYNNNIWGMEKARSFCSSKKLGHQIVITFVLFNFLIQTSIFIAFLLQMN